MKKILILVLTLLAMTMLFSFPAFAGESDAVLKVQYDSETKEFSVFDDGWNFAMETAKTGKEVTVTLLKDWIAEDGQFTDEFINGAGFDYDAIYFADDVKMTLDLNGHTIDRGLTGGEPNGEVMFINDDATITIKNGTIKGGCSTNGAGGIHIENANVTLLDLVFTDNVVGNDDGAALQHTDGGELYIKNCRFENNRGTVSGFDVCGTVFLSDVDKVVIEDSYFANNTNIDYGAGIYASCVGTLQVKNCTFENLNAGDRGGAIWVGGYGHKLYAYNCTFKNNSSGNYGGAIYADAARLIIDDSTFTGNYADWDGGAIYLDGTAQSTNSVNSELHRCTFDGNGAGLDGGALFCNIGTLDIVNTTSVYSYGCTFENNKAEGQGGAVYVDPNCTFRLFSDDVSGKPSIIKNNVAGNCGGGVFVEEHWLEICWQLILKGEVYVYDNVSSEGADDVYAEDGYSVGISGEITSPAGSIGIRIADVEEGLAATFSDEIRTPSIAPFFANNEGYKMTSKKSDYGAIHMHMTKSAVAGSIFGEGSLTMTILIVSVLALVSSCVCIFMIADVKKKLVPANTTKTESEE
jgi:predicted outer membrane repeat protein